MTDAEKGKQWMSEEVAKKPTSIGNMDLSSLPKQLKDSLKVLNRTTLAKSKFMEKLTDIENYQKNDYCNWLKDQGRISSCGQAEDHPEPDFESKPIKWKFTNKDHADNEDGTGYAQPGSGSFDLQAWNENEYVSGIQTWA